MNLIISRKELRESPEIREPNAEALHLHPEQFVARLRAGLPAGTVITEVRRVDYHNHMHDRCTALLLMTKENSAYLLMNELGTDPVSEMTAAGRALATALKTGYAEGEPPAWPATHIPFLARLFGYAG